MRIDLHIFHHFDATPASLASLLESAMSAIADKINAKIDAASKSFDAALSRVTTDLDKLKETIADLTAQQANANLTDDEEAAIEARIADLQAKADAMDAAVVPPVTPPVTDPNANPTT